MRIFAGAVVFLLCGWGTVAHGQAGEVANPSFEAGEKTPKGWNLSKGKGEWLKTGGLENSACVTVEGDGKSDGAWLSDPVTFLPAHVYRFSFSARGEDAGGGTAVSGPAFANVDVGIPGKEWALYENVFAAPFRKDDLTVPLHLGQWQLKGKLFFDDVRLVPVQPVYSAAEGLVLGTGEQVEGNAYSFDAPLASECRNHSRPLAGFTAHFNSDRWCFGEGVAVTYRHALAGRRFLSGALDVSCGYHVSGRLLVDVSPDAKTWQHVGVLTNTGGLKVDLPKALFPAEAVFVRLRGGKAPCSFQVQGYAFHGETDGKPLSLVGSTRYVEEHVTSANKMKVQVLGLGDAVPGGDNCVDLQLRNLSRAVLPAEARVIFSRPGAASATNALSLKLPAGEAFNVRVPYEIPGTGLWRMSVEVGNAYTAVDSVLISEYYDDSYGELIPVNNPKLNLWRASSGWKIPQRRALPRQIAKALVLRAARNEWEALQLVVAPNVTLSNLTVRASELTLGLGKNKIPAENIQVLRVGYVPVTKKTDRTGTLADWPDPLPPQKQPIGLAAGMNQPYWIRVKVPKDIPAGIYRGAVTVEADGVKASTILNVEVYDFVLPDTLTCSTSFGFSPGTVWRYQRVTDPAQRRDVLDKYLTSLSEHHVSPYNPAPMDKWSVAWTGLNPWQGGTIVTNEKAEPVFDWSAWDAAMTRAFETYHFNSFVMHLDGLGGGTFQERYEPSFLGYAETAPEYDVLFGKYLKGIEAHLKEKGWLDKAYVYWFDEPDPKDYAFVMNGFAKLKKHAPGLRRMLTEQVEKELVGGPNLWVPLTPSLNVAGAAERRTAGDQFWWYVCCGPKAPYATEFIDHSGTEMRVWLWQTWAERVTGVLIWETVWWTSDTAYPDPAKLQNPYLDPMSWVGDGHLAPGTKSAWGNGDGRLMYPPEAAADGRPSAPVLDGPVDSIRFEMLRDGLEDYEYFAILKRLLDEKAPKMDPRMRADCEALLTVPADVSASLTRFTRDPAMIEAHRDRLARAIVELVKAR